MFDNAETVTINNKEVKSIKLSSNNAVLYEKPLLSLVTDKSTLSYHNGDSATLTATLKKNGKGIAGETITFYNNSYYQNMPLGDEWVIKISGNSNGWLIIGDSSNYCIRYNVSGIVGIVYRGDNLTSFDCGDYLELNDGVLYGSNGNSLDISSYNIDMSRNSPTNDTTVLFIKGSSTTNANGVVTFTYDSSKAGDITLIVSSSNYNLSDSVAIHDYDYYPNDILLTASPNIIQSGDVSDVSAIVSDDDGDAIGSGQQVYFYKEVDTNLTVTSDTPIIQAGDTANIFATYTENNKPISNKKIDFYKE